MSSRSLQAQLRGRIALVSLVALGMMVVLLSFLMHRHMHKQTDALLLHLADAEANNIIEEGKDFHVHSMSIHLPSLTGGLSQRFAMVLSPDRTVLDHTRNLQPGRTVPEHWQAYLVDRPVFINTDALTDQLLRVVIFPMELEGEPAYVCVGVAHDDLDASLWTFVAIAIPIALLAALLITSAGVWLIRRRLSDLSRLSDACRQLELFSGKISGDTHHQTLTVPEQAAEEFQLLAHTLRDLMDRVQSLLETQNRFVAEAAHELRTPLTSLRGDLELALRRERPAEDYREFIGQALQDVDRLQNLAVQLLEGSRGRDGNLACQKFDLQDILQQVKNHRIKAIDQAQFQLHIQEGSTRVYANQSALVRVFENLIDNSLRHSGGSQINISWQSKGEGLQIIVTDNGGGVPKTLHERLFHPFQKGATTGFGLGLYIAHQLMIAQGGNLNLDVDYEGGARWEIFLTLICR